MNAVEKAKRELVNIAYKICREELGFETWGNISCRPAESHIVITPSGIPYDQLRYFDLVDVDASGKTLKGRWKPSTELPLHLAIYKKRNKCQAIVHVHSLYATAFAVSRVEIPPALEEQAQVVGGAVKVAAYAPPGSPELAANALAALGEEGNAVLLANHGLVSIGADLSSALRCCRVIERNARIILLSRMLGQPHVLNPEDVEALKNNFLLHYGQHDRQNCTAKGDD